MPPSALDIAPEVREAVATGRPVVALESTLIAHGLPFPANVETARAAEAAVRAEGAVPATVAVWQGRPTVGLSGDRIDALARAEGVLKASRRDLALAMARGLTAATTVSATMLLAARAGIRLFATGGIGGVHRGASDSWDVSADLTELTRTPVAVVCAGAKCILDLPRTLEVLETLGVPVVGYGTSDFPAFYTPTSGHPLTARVDTPEEAAALLAAHWSLGLAGVVLAQPVPATSAIPDGEIRSALARAEDEAAARHLTGPAVTPFLLSRLAALTGGRTVEANRALIIANATLAARTAQALASRS